MDEEPDSYNDLFTVLLFMYGCSGDRLFLETAGILPVYPGAHKSPAIKSIRKAGYESEQHPCFCGKYSTFLYYSGLREKLHHDISAKKMIFTIAEMRNEIWNDSGKHIDE